MAKKKKALKKDLKKLEKKATQLKSLRKDLEAQIELLTQQRDEALQRVAALEAELAKAKEKPANGRRKRRTARPAAEETTATRPKRTRKSRTATADQTAPSTTSRTRKSPASTATAGDTPRKTTRRRRTTTAPKTAAIDFSKIGTATAAEKDNLRLIKGIGPAAERKLNSLGIYTYRQIANLTPEAEKIITEKVGFFEGRIQRDKWKEQARALMKSK